MKRVKCEEIPVFCGLVVSKGFDPDHQGPPPAGAFAGLGIEYGQYAMDLNDPRWRRTLSAPEMMRAMTTQTMTLPTIGGEDGSS